MEELRPVELDHVVSRDKAGNPPRPLPAGGAGFLETRGDGVSLITWKVAEDGNGSILRLAETSGNHTNATIRFLHLKLYAAEICSGVEGDQNALAIEDSGICLSFNPFEVLTIRVLARP